MAKRDTTTYDVYLSHAMGDASIASEVAYHCLRSGLGVFHVPDEPLPHNIESAMREALVECRALILIVPPSGLSNLQVIEFGGAWGWEKPIYAIAADAATTRLSGFLSHIRLYPIGRIDEVIRAIKLIDQQWDDEDRGLLIGLFAEADIPLDDLALEPERLGEISRAFHKARRKAFSEDRLLSEFFRLRKQGKLPKIRTPRRTRSRGHPA